jgi:predicted MFS family arabinose efflux permease
MKHIASSPRYRYLVLAGCCLLQFGGMGVQSNSMGIFYPYVCQELGFSVAQLSLHTTIRGLVTTLFLPLAGWLFSKVNPRVLLTAAGAMLCGSTLSMAFFHHVYQWYLASAFAGVAGAFLFLTATPILLTRWFPRKSGMAIGIAMAFTGLGGAVMSPLGTWWTEQWGWRSAYLLFGTVGAATILPCTLLVLGMPSPDPAVAPQEEGQSPPQGNSLLRQPILWMFLVAVLMIAYPTAYVFHFSTYAISVGLTSLVGATMASVSMVSNIAGKVAFGCLSRRYPTKWITFCSAALLLAGYALFLLFPDREPFLYAASGLYGICLAMTPVMVPLMVEDLFPSHQYSMALSIASMVTSATGGLGIAFAGLLYDTTGSYRLCFQAALLTTAGLMGLLHGIYAYQGQRSRK